MKRFKKGGIIFYPGDMSYILKNLLNTQIKEYIGG